MAEEKTFLNEGGVLVTNARFVVPAQTYAMSGVTSVKSHATKPSRVGPIILIIIGLLSLVVGVKGLIPALIFLGAGIAWWIAQKPTYTVLLNSSSGEAKALSSKDGNYIANVINALNDAIVHRG